jgi:hypothetical protein
MEIRLIFLNLKVSDGASCLVFPYWIGNAGQWLPGNSPFIKTVPKPTQVDGLNILRRLRELL